MKESDANFDKIRDYVDHNPVATIGTVNLEGAPHGAVVYVCADKTRRIIYFLTKVETQKYINLKKSERVSLTIANPEENSTLQVDGKASIVKDSITGTRIVERITQLHDSAVDWLPPVSKLNAGAYVLVAVEVWHARLAHFQGMAMGDVHMFTQA